jgi:thioredoxin 1
MLEQLNEQTFNEKVLSSSERVAVLFHAPWANPSIEMFLKLEPYPVYHVDIEETPEVAAIVAIRAVPTLMVFRDGQIVTFKIGLMEDNDLVSFLKQETLI